MNLLVYLFLAALVVYVLFTFFFKSGKKTSIASEIHLARAQPDVGPPLPSPGAVNFTYSLWLYVNSWSGAGEKLIFSAVDNSSTPKVMQKLFFDGSDTAKLLYSARHAKVSGQDSQTNVIQITDAFPLQKWVHLVVVTSGDNLDFYLDGKLRHSATLSAKAEQNTHAIKFGKDFDCHLSKFYREIDTSLRAPIEVEREYLRGSGARAFASASSVHGSVQITKDGEVASQIRLF